MVQSLLARPSDPERAHFLVEVASLEPEVGRGLGDVLVSEVQGALDQIAFGGFQHRTKRRLRSEV